MKKMDDSGQAVVEYILMLLVALGIVVILARGLQTSLRLLWKTMGNEIIAACPSCPPNSP